MNSQWDDFLRIRYEQNKTITKLIMALKYLSGVTRVVCDLPTWVTSNSKLSVSSAFYLRKSTTLKHATCHRKNDCHDQISCQIILRGSSSCSCLS